MGHQHHCGIEREQRLLEPLERVHVEVIGGLIERQQVGIARERTGERRSRLLAPGERAELPVQVHLRAEAQTRQRTQGAFPPAVSACVLESRLRVRVALQSRTIMLARGHPLLQPGELPLDLHQLARTGEHVLPQRCLRARLRWPLIGQRDADVFTQHELATVERELAGQHAQQRRLAGSVRRGKRHPVGALQLE